MIELNEVLVTQNGVRSIAQVCKMIEFVRTGGVFDLECLRRNHTSDWRMNLILITRLEDGSKFLHDGHHRALSIFLAGRDHFKPEEVEYLDDLSLEKYQEVNLKTGWLTPFCLKTEVRKPDVEDFKRQARQRPDSEIETWVRSRRELFCQPRAGINTVADLAAYMANMGIVCEA